MTLQARWNLQRGVPENKIHSATDYTSDGSLIDQYILAKVQVRNKMQERIILDPAAYNALVDQAAADIGKRVEDLFKEWR